MDKLKGYSLAQKMVGRACGYPEGEGVPPNQYCEPKMTTVGSQDTTGPMTRDELKDLACLGFSADLVMQSFCHTAAYPKPVDVITHHTLPDFIRTRGGVSLRPGDGIIHSWLNRMLLPDTAATGVMPLDMPESVLVRFSGSIQPGITLRDLVHAIPKPSRRATSPWRRRARRTSSAAASWRSKALATSSASRPSSCPTPAPSAVPPAAPSSWTRRPSRSTSAPTSPC